MVHEIRLGESASVQLPHLRATLRTQDSLLEELPEIGQFPTEMHLETLVGFFHLQPTTHKSPR